MSNELKEAIKIALECVIFASLILIIAVFGNFARESLVMKNNQDITMTDIKEYRDIYSFTKGNELVLEALNNDLSIDLDTSVTVYTKSQIKKLDSYFDFFEYKENCKDCMGVNLCIDCKYYNYFEDNNSEYISGKKVRKKLNSDMTGEDVIRFLSVHPKEYNVIIFKNDNLYKFLKTSTDEEWQMSYIIKNLITEAGNKYFCIGIYDSDKYVYDTILFLEAKSIKTSLSNGY